MSIVGRSRTKADLVIYGRSGMRLAKHLESRCMVDACRAGYQGCRICCSWILWSNLMLGTFIYGQMLQFMRIVLHFSWTVAIYALCRVLAEMSRFMRFARHKFSADRHLKLFCTPAGYFHGYMTYKGHTIYEEDVLKVFLWVGHRWANTNTNIFETA